jgi:hypothetical protein
MGNPQDPYSDLLKRFQARKQDYLRRLTTDEATFEQDPEANGVALRRGFIKGQAPRPQCSLLDQDNAGVAADDNHHLVVWTDCPCLRAGVGDPWDVDDFHGAIARLTIYADPEDFQKAIIVPAPPAETQTGLRFRAVMALARQLAVTGKSGLRWKIRALLSPIFITNQGFGQPNIFPSDLVERVVCSLDSGPDPDPSDRAKITELTNLLAPLYVEGNFEPMGANAAHDQLVGLYTLLPSDIVGDLVRAAVQNGTQFSLTPLGQQMGSQVWGSLETLSQFGQWESDPSTATVRNMVLAIAHWLAGSPASLPEKIAKDGQAPSLIQELFGTSWVPDGFVWPPFDQAGIYWWRTVIQGACIEHCYALKDTADFKSTDLLRLLLLFPDSDTRIPDYVRNAARLALIWFKYWWDEPAAKDSSGKDIAEMTFWSENHQILFAQSQLLAGAMFRGTAFPRSGNASSKTKTGQDHVNEAIPKVERWLDRRLKFGFSEWNAPGYYNEDLPALFNLVDFCDTAAASAASDDERQALARIKSKAAMTLDLMFFEFARFTCRGSFGVTAGRAYWEHKCYGWEQSIGNTIEVLFGTRGDYMGSEPAAVSLATSTYDVPEALLGIGLDRVILDRTLPYSDRCRDSINFDDAGDYQIGFDSEDDSTFWWGLEAYYTEKTITTTKRVVQAHDNLRMCGPFEPLYAISDGWFKQTVLDLISATVDALQVAGGVALAVKVPFPLNIVAVAFEGKSIVDGFIDFFKDAWDAIKSVGKAIGHFLGLGDDKPEIPDSALQQVVEKLLVAFNTGGMLSRANIVTYSNGDAMLSSVQNHMVGQVAFQKHPWAACLGNEACVWTTARFMKPDPGSYGDAMERFLGDIGALHVKEAVVDIGATPVLQAVGGGDPFGHDGPNYWTGSLALPFIVQHENAAIIVYSIPKFQRTVSGASTHAWFPQAKFDNTSKQDANEGTWFFGRKDAPDGAGSGYVALFSALKCDWTNESGNAWNGKEIMTHGDSNIWVCVIGNQQQFGSFDTFRQEVLNAYLNISGLGGLDQLECSFDIPRASSPPGASPRLEAFYDDRKGRFAGNDIELDNFPRFENKYVAQMVTRGPLGSGLRPQVESFGTQNSVGFGSTSYRIMHPATGLSLDHDLTTPARSHTSQTDQPGASPRRLVSGSLTAVRRPNRRTQPERPLVHPKLDRSGIRRRKA